MKAKHFASVTLLTFLGCLPIILQAQKKKPLPEYIEPNLKTTDPNQVISAKTYHKILDQNYSSIATGQGQGTSLSNFGSFDPVAGAFKLNSFARINFVKKEAKSTTKKIDPSKTWYLNLSVGGNIIGNNVGVLFNNSKFNSGTTVTAKLFIPVGGNSIVIAGRTADTLISRKKDLEYMRWAEKMKVWNTVNPNQLSNALIEIKAKIKKSSLTLYQKRQDSMSVRQAIDMQSIRIEDTRSQITEQKYNDLISTLVKLSDSLLNLSGQIDSAIRNNLALQIKKDSLQHLYEIVYWDIHHQTLFSPDADNANYGSRLYSKIDEKYDALIDSLDLAVHYMPYTLSWLAVVGNFNRNNYYTYNSTLPYSQQISNDQLSVFSAGLEYNFLHEGLEITHALNIGLIRLRNNNIGDLSTSALSQQVKTTENDTTQTVTKNYNVYTAAITEYEAWKFYLNYYLFFGKASTKALHLLEETEFRDTHQTPVNLGLGYVFSFKNSKDNSVINVEAYIKFMDVFKALPEQQAFFYNRNVIGLQFGIPYNLPQPTIPKPNNIPWQRYLNPLRQEKRLLRLLKKQPKNQRQRQPRKSSC